MTDSWSTSGLLETDQAYLGRSCGAMPGTPPPHLVESASGVRLRLAREVNGQRELIDGMPGSWRP